MHIGQTKIAPRVAIGQALVVEAQEMQDGGVQIVNVDRLLDCREAELIGGAVDVAAAHAAAGQEHGEAVVIMIAAVDLSLV